MDRLLLESQKPLTLDAIRELRHLLEQVAQAVVPDPSILQRILLCLSEAVTNLVLHATPKADQVTVRFGRDSLGWWLEILDQGAPWDPTRHQPTDIRPHFELTESGRGIALLHSQCEQIEYTSGGSDYSNRLRLVWKHPKQPLRPTILIVEDDAALCRLYAAYLAEDFEVQTASDGHEALELLTAAKIDLVLSDINMPQMSGISLREQLNQTRGSELIPFIFLTALDKACMHERAASLGIDDYLVKPVNKAQLIHVIDRVLGRSRQIYRQLTDRIDKRITSALAPRLPEISHGWRLCVANRHTGVGGGDLLLHRTNEAQLTLVLLDIMGHNDSAKFFAYAYGGYLRGLMHSNAAEVSPSRLLEILSESALQDELLSQVILTSCAVALSPEGRLSLACAGHPPPLRINRQGTEAVQVSGILPGLLPGTTYQTEPLQLASGERLALYTDGLFESAVDADARKELEIRIRNALSDTLDVPIKQSLQQVMGMFDELAGTPPLDDALLLLIEPIETVPNID